MGKSTVQSNNRTIHVASAHHPADARIVEKECTSLVRAGYRVEFVIPADSDAVVDGVQITGVPLPSSGRERLTKTRRQIYEILKRRDASVPIHFHDAELLPQMILLALRGRTIIYDAHEDTPKQTMQQHWIPALLRRPVSEAYRALEWIAGRRFAAIVAATPAIAQRYPADRTYLVRNFPRLESFDSVSEQPYSTRDPVVAYVGGIAAKRGAREMVDAIGLVRDQNATLLLAGPFHPQTLRAELEAHPSWHRVNAPGWLNRDEVVAQLGRARIGLVTLRPSPQYEEAYPTKLIEYMAAGIPFVASDFPLWRSLFGQFDCGLFVDPTNPRAIADAMDTLLTNPDRAAEMGRRGRQAAVDHFNWRNEEAVLLSMYESLQKPG